MLYPKRKCKIRKRLIDIRSGNAKFEAENQNSKRKCIIWSGNVRSPTEKPHDQEQRTNKMRLALISMLADFGGDDRVPFLMLGFFTQMHLVTATQISHLSIGVMNKQRRENMVTVLERLSWPLLLLWFSQPLGVWEGRRPYSIDVLLIYSPARALWPIVPPWPGSEAHYHFPCFGQRRCASVLAEGSDTG